MASNRPAKSRRCMGRSFQQSFAARFFVASEDHGLHVADAILGEEHVLGAAQADAFGAVQARDFGVAGNIGVGAHAEFAAKFVGPVHQFREIAGLGIGQRGFRLAQKTCAVVPSMEIQSPSFTVMVFAPSATVNWRDFSLMD